MAFSAIRKHIYFAIFRYFHMAVTVRNNIKNKNKAELYTLMRPYCDLILLYYYFM